MLVALPDGLGQLGQLDPRRLGQHLGLVGGEPRPVLHQVAGQLGLEARPERAHVHHQRTRGRRARGGPAPPPRRCPRPCDELAAGGRARALRSPRSHHEHPVPGRLGPARSRAVSIDTVLDGRSRRPGPWPRPPGHAVGARRARPGPVRRRPRPPPPRRSRRPARPGWRRPGPGASKGAVASARTSQTVRSTPARSSGVGHAAADVAEPDRPPRRARRMSLSPVRRRRQRPWALLRQLGRWIWTAFQT